MAASGDGVDYAALAAHPADMDELRACAHRLTTAEAGTLANPDRTGTPLGSRPVGNARRADLAR